jgi:uncharacterized membrane protein YtjA (UPF0391 family)
LRAQARSDKLTTKALIEPSPRRSRRNSSAERAFCLRMNVSKEVNMGSLLHYAILFLIVAIIAAFFGFGGVAGTAMEGARILFWVALVLFVISAVAGFLRRA